MTPLRAKYIRDLVIHGRSKHTEEAYTRYVCDLARYYRRSPELISYEEVTGWLYHLIKERQLSDSSVNIAVSAVRFFYAVTLGRETLDLMASVPHMKRATRPGEVYAHSEVEAILTAPRQPRGRPMTPLRAKYIRDLVIRGRSKHTQEAYIRYVCDLARYYRRSPELISYEEVTGWLYHLIKERQLSASSVNIAVSAVRFFYAVTLGRETLDLMASVPHMKRATRPGEVYAHSEVEAILTAPRQPRGRPMTPLRAKYIRDLVIRGRSKHTQEAYIRYVCDLARYYRRSPELISYEEVTGWLYHLIKERQLSASSVNIAVSAVRFFYAVTLGRETLELMASVSDMKRVTGRAEVYAHSEVEAILTAPRQPRGRPMTPLRAKYIRDLVIRGRSKHTQEEAYIRYVCDLARYYRRSPELISYEEVTGWLYHLIKERQLSASSVNIAVSA